MPKYIGITIGPIYNTISEARNPAGLWFASSIFSEITRMLCGELHQLNSTESMKVNIISPYYDGIEGEYDGIGKYHDRIIFSVDNWISDKMQDIIDKVKGEIVELLPEGYKNDLQKEFIKNYLNINYVVKDIEGDVNPILELSPYLDAIELMPNVIKAQKDNPFESLLNKKECNDKIKGTAKSNKQLLSNVDNESIRSIEEIAGVKEDSKEKSEEKSKAYFATVAADGDNMGAFLKELTSDEEIRVFSGTCLEYSKAAAKLIGDFGGMTIYAGGDDLLFLAPVIGNGGKLIIELCNDLNDLFKEKIESKLPEKLHEFIPTISSGIAIHYYKYPLYEALANARKLLGDIKSTKSKNGIALNVEKHSGQSMKLVVRNNSVDNNGNNVKNLVKNLLKYNFTEVITDKKVNGAIYTIENMHKVISVIDDKDMSKDDYIKIWLNFFDNEAQEKDEKYHVQLAGLYCDMYKKKSIDEADNKSNDNSEEKPTDKLYEQTDFTMLLRFDKFLRE